MKKRKDSFRFNAKYVDNDKLTRGGRKRESNYYRRRIRNKKIAYISFLVRNTDQITIVSSITYPEIKPGLIDRLLVLAQRESVRPLILITKTDMEKGISPPLPLSSNQVQKIYTDAGFTTLCLSNTDPSDEKHEAVRDLLRDRLTAVVGHSGVGKTTLLKRLDTTYTAKTQNISAYTRRGRHTTTSIRMHKFAFGGKVYDMPGLKEIDFIDLEKRELSLFYPDFESHARGCHFSDCLHVHEKSCGVKEAVRRDAISDLRYENYLNILADLPS